ncbi:MAG: helix-turn-helix transcriptional regulator [Desulfobacterium sp.]|nr:helix-turn-helix transcriptional regulator [Desulfobacterium sp.]
MSDLINSLKQAFNDKEYRHGYVDEFLNASIATQIKVLREQREWSQKELADYAGMMQPRISVMENVNYSSWSIKILRKIAEAFDLTLCVSFEGFGKRVEDIDNFTRKDLERDSFPEDLYFKGESEEAEITADCEKYLESPTEGNVIRPDFWKRENNVPRQVVSPPVTSYTGNDYSY